MKILINSLNYVPEPTGIAPYSAGLAAGLAARGHDVHVLTTFAHYPAWRFTEPVAWRRHERLDDAQVTKLRHYVPAEPAAARRALSEVSFGLRSVGRRWHRPDVVVCVSPGLLSTGLAQVRARLGRGRPPVGIIVQDLYGLGMREAKGSSGVLASVVARAERGLLGTADGVSVIHERMRRVVIDELGVDASRVVVNRNWTHLDPIPEPDRADARLRLGWAADDVIVLHTGAMGEKQALDNVVEAGRLVVGSDSRVRFVLVGDGSQRRRLEKLAEGVDSVTVLDPLESGLYGEALRCADVLLVNERPGLTDMAVPSKLTSYFTAGRPIVAAVSAAGTTAHEIEASGAGVRVDPGDPRALLDAVEALHASPDRADELGRRGPTYSREVLDQERILDDYESWLTSLAARPSRHETR